MKITERVIQKLRDRSDKGLEKYGTTMDRMDLPAIAWMRHAQEEAIDFAIYLEKLIEVTKTD